MHSAPESANEECKKYGFTLIDLLIFLAIMVILKAIAVPGLPAILCCGNELRIHQSVAGRLPW
jgi:Tfp pilus assembly protein FimT